MAKGITRHIPNFVTCCNLLSGCIAAVMAFQANYEAAILFIILGATFDFFDGMLARLFKVSGPLGKELDSLADDITFGFAPSVIVFSLFKEVQYSAFLQPVEEYFPYTAFIIAAFSALRLGKIQHRSSSKQFIHRIADPCQRIVLGVLGSRRSFLPCFGFFQCLIPIDISHIDVLSTDS